MKKEKEKALDNVFRKGLGDPVEADYREGDWNALEQMLDRSKKRGGIVFWLPILGAAAVLLIAFGWWVMRPEVIQHERQKPQQAAVRQPERSTAPTGTSTNSKVIAANTPQTSSVNEQPGSNAAPGKKLADNTVATSHSVINSHPSKNKPGVMLTANTKATGTTPGAEEMGNKTHGNITLVAFEPAITLTKPGDQAITAFNVQPVTVTAKPSAVRPSRIAVKTGFFAHPQYAIRVIGAPEINGVNSLAQTRTGTNGGLLFAVGFKGLTLSTGALYSIKPYDAYFNSYANSKFSSNLTSINANCHVLDIPINFDYQFYNKHQNKFSIGTGISSYIMLHESYQFNYSNPAIQGPYNYTVPNTDKYFFDILNLQATYTRQVNSSVGLSIEPYMKLPLAGIGANQAKLQTAGVAIGLSWNLNSTSKPK